MPRTAHRRGRRFVRQPSDARREGAEKASGQGYDESAGGIGIVYTLISTLTGFTPRITASVKETLAPGSGAKAEVNTTKETYPDQVEVELSIPGSWNFDKGIQDIVEANVDVSPSVELRNIGNHGTNEVSD